MESEPVNIPESYDPDMCDYSAVDSSRLLDALTLYSDHMFLLLL